MSANNGKPCKNCGGNDWNNDLKCRKCKSDHDRNYRISHYENVNAKKKQYREQNPEKVRAGYLSWLENNKDKKSYADKRWQLANKDRVYANHAKWRSKDENKAKISVITKRWKAENKEHDRQWHKEWAIKNHDSCIARNHKRRALLRGGGSYTAKEWNNLLDMSGHKCLCCGRGDVQLTVDHVIPVSKGGSNTIDNLQPLCLSCNVKKHTKTIEYRNFKVTGIYRE